MTMKIAHGILNWTRDERVSNRYGAFYLDDTPFSMGPATVATEPWCDVEAVKALQGKRVRLWCTVVEARDSEHVGDVFLKIRPSRPDVGERIDLGIGRFSQEESPYAGEPPLFCLAPEDGRSDLWIDPRALYRVHSQTVDLWAEETADACSPAPDLKCEDPGRIAVEGGIQGKRISETEMLRRVPPTIEPIGEGVFVLSAPKVGDRVQSVDDDTPTV